MPRRWQRLRGRGGGTAGSVPRARAAASSGKRFQVAIQGLLRGSVGFPLDSPELWAGGHLAVSSLVRALRYVQAQSPVCFPPPPLPHLASCVPKLCEEVRTHF